MSATLTKLFKDKNELAIFLVGFLVEIGFGFYLVQRWGYTFPSGDDISHIYKARVVIDNGANSGFGALGVVWLPIFQILLMPLVLIDTLYTTGFAGTIINALATGGICVILFRMLENTYLKMVGVLLFLCNIFTLIYGSVPMNVQLTVLFMILGAYFFKHYWEKHDIVEFLKCSLVLTLASLTRYEGWVATFLVMFLFVLRELKNKRYHRLAYAHFPAWGIFAWLFWNMALFRDPLSFLSHPLHATAQDWMLPYSWSLELTTINVINAISVIFGPLWIISALSLLILMKRDSKFITSLILLTPILSHWLLIYTNISLGSIRFFYLGYVGMVLTPLLALDSFYKQNTNKRRARLTCIIIKVKPIVIGLLLCSMHACIFFAFITQVDIIIVGKSESYSFTFTSIDFIRVDELKSEILRIKKEIGSGGTILCPFDSVLSSRLSVFTGMSPSIFYDGYACEQAMITPWIKYDFAIFNKRISEDDLVARNNYFKSVYGIPYCEYLYYKNSSWKENFLSHYVVVSETSHYLVFRRISVDESRSYTG